MADEQKPMSDVEHCEHGEAVKWNPYNGVVQCHRCGETFVPRADVERLRAKEAALWAFLQQEAYSCFSYDAARWAEFSHWLRDMQQKQQRPVEEFALLTPFAQHLQTWLWTGRGYGESAWSRHQLAQELDVPDDTVEAWFVPDIPGSAQRPSYPEPRVFWRLQRLTGWKRDLMALLCGYSRLPPHEE